MDRTLRAARALNARFQNPDVAAFNRSHRARTERSRLFWLGVGRFLFRPYRGMGWTNEEAARWAAIKAT